MKVPAIVVRVFPRSHCVVTHYNEATFLLEFLCPHLNLGRLHPAIVISLKENVLTVQSLYEFLCCLVVSETEISCMDYNITTFDNAVMILNDLLIHFFHVIERSVRKAKNIRVIEMLISRKKVHVTYFV